MLFLAIAVAIGDGNCFPVSCGAMAGQIKVENVPDDEDFLKFICNTACIQLEDNKITAKQFVSIAGRKGVAVARQMYIGSLRMDHFAHRIPQCTSLKNKLRLLADILNGEESGDVVLVKDQKSSENRSEDMHQKEQMVSASNLECPPVHKSHQDVNMLIAAHGSSNVSSLPLPTVTESTGFPTVSAGHRRDGFDTLFECNFLDDLKQESCSTESAEIRDIVRTLHKEPVTIGLIREIAAMVVGGTAVLATQALRGQAVNENVHTEEVPDLKEPVVLGYLVLVSTETWQLARRCVMEADPEATVQPLYTALSMNNVLYNSGCRHLYVTTVGRQEEIFPGYEQFGGVISQSIPVMDLTRVYASI